MTEQFMARLEDAARRIQHFGVRLSAVLGALVGSCFGAGVGMAWDYAFGGFLILLFVGMAVVVLSATSGRVAANDWRTGLALSCRIFFLHTTIYGLAVLTLGWLLPAVAPQLADLNVATLALQMLPGLYIVSVLAVLASGPLYLRWLAVPEERRRPPR